MLILCEGIDRTGKSTLSNYYASLGYEVVHMSAPKDVTADDYLQGMAELVSSAAAKNIFCDRSYYGELIWPTIYGRKPLLDDSAIEILKEIEDTVGTQRILMHDPNTEEHWKRCVQNKEPLTKAQFARAKSLYSQMAHKYYFELVTLPQFLKQYPEAEKFNSKPEVPVAEVISTVESTPTTPIDPASDKSTTPGLSLEQIKLKKANAIDDVLSKRILKSRGMYYDEIESEIRIFLNQKMGQLLGNSQQEKYIFTEEEVSFYKAMYKKAITKGDSR